MSARNPETGQFLQGLSGNPAGRPKGARSKLSEAFLADMLEAWEESGVDAIKKVISDRPHEFIKVVAGLMPRDINLNVNPLDAMTDDDLISRAKELAAALDIDRTQAKVGRISLKKLPTKH